jgi:signal transduction histidine kinase
LLDNAIRHTPDGGSVVLDGEAAGPVVAVSVADECGGIPESDLPRVFDVAFRGDAARNRDTGGGGLGLAIARGLLEVHDGTLQVVNRQRGCRFTLRLPTITA